MRAILIKSSVKIFFLPAAASESTEKEDLQNEQTDQIDNFSISKSDSDEDVDDGVGTGLRMIQPTRLGGCEGLLKECQQVIS